MLLRTAELLEEVVQRLILGDEERVTDELRPVEVRLLLLVGNEVLEVEDTTDIVLRPLVDGDT